MKVRLHRDSTELLVCTLVSGLGLVLAAWLIDQTTPAWCLGLVPWPVLFALGMLAYLFGGLCHSLAFPVRARARLKRSRQGGR